MKRFSVLAASTLLMLAIDGTAQASGVDGLNTSAGVDMPIGASQSVLIRIGADYVTHFLYPNSTTSMAYLDHRTGFAQFTGGVMLGSDQITYGPGMPTGRLSFGSTVISGNDISGDNTDPIFFERQNVAPDVSELHLVLGDNPTEPGSTDSLVIGGIDWTRGYAWTPAMQVNAMGIANLRNALGIGTTSGNFITPLAPLHVKAQTLDNNMPSLLVEEASSGLSSPRIAMVDTALGDVATAPAWFVDNVRDRFRIFRQPNISTAGFEAFTVTKEARIGVNTPAPKATLDVNGFAKLALNAAAPAVCTGDTKGSVAMTQAAHLCVCNGSNWVDASNYTTACAW